jgi:hypothetical protein
VVDQADKLRLECESRCVRGGASTSGRPALTAGVPGEEPGAVGDDLTLSKHGDQRFLIG